MECPSCATQVAEGKRFCTSCGTALPLICPSCGAINPNPANFCGDCGTQLAQGTAPVTAEGRTVEAASASASQVLEPERRQVTVLFCDIIGSTELSARLDPEDLRDVISGYQQVCASVISRYEGYLARYLGDGILAYFGYPQAHEDDAERAVRVGLELIRQVEETQDQSWNRFSIDLALRIGIATGLVVAGDIVSGETAEEKAVVGPTPNLASRLQELAQRNSVVIAPETRRLVGGLFEYADTGRHRLKGFAEPVQTWQVLRASGAESRFQALHASGVNPLVGREHEIAILLDRFEQAKDSDGQVVLLSGEAGIGKSRIAETLRDRLSGEGVTVVRCYCSTYHQNSALYPVIELLERACQLTSLDDAAQKLDKLESFLETAGVKEENTTRLLAELLSIPPKGRFPPLELQRQELKDRTLDALISLFESLSDRQPILILFEDLHWIDATSQELLGLMVSRFQRRPVLLVATFRPDFVPPWTGYSHVMSYSLSRLTRKQAAAMVKASAAGKVLPAELSEQIIAKTDGVPLFIEELTKSILESDLVSEEAESYSLVGSLSSMAIPATLKDSLMARLDRLAPVKEVAQIGAAIGREFSLELLSAVSPLREAELHDALEKLVESELIFKRTTHPETIYVFKHALVQDAAYESLLHSRRHQLHSRIATVLETQFPDTSGAQPELLAYHFAQAGIGEKAVAYWLTAGQHAIERSANAEAIAHLTSGLEILKDLPDLSDRAGLELGFQIGLGDAYRATKGTAALETESAFVRARELSEALGDGDQLIRALYGQYLSNYNRGRLDVAHEVAGELLRLADRQNDPAAMVIGDHAAGRESFSRGVFAAARAHLERAVVEENLERYRAKLGDAQYPSMPLMYLAWTLFALGYPDQAKARCDEALAEARDMSPFTYALAQTNACYFNQFIQDAPAILQHTEELVPLATERKIPVLAAIGTLLRGWATIDGGDAATGISMMESGLQTLRAMDQMLEAPYFMALLAQARGACQQPEEARKLFAEAESRIEQGGERWHEAELRRLEGELHLSGSRPDPERAEAYFRRALDLAQEQGAKSWELRAATSLARLWQSQNRSAEARDLLAPIHAWFGEGLDTPDLQTAGALLTELDSPQEESDHRPKATSR